MNLIKFFQKAVVGGLLAVAGIASADIIGGPATPVTGNCFPFGCGFNGQYQQVYAGSAFSGPITITSIDFFNTQFDAFATGMNSGNWAISLSTSTTAGPSNISSNASSNIGADNALVFNGDLAQSWTFGNTLHIVLANSFVYNPGAGNLLMDVIATGVVASGGSIFFDLNTGAPDMARYFNGNVSFQYGLVTGFNNDGVNGTPEPGSLALVALGLLGAATLRRRSAKTAPAS